MLVAVRSSATAEDLPTASFAGQQETFLNVTGKEQVLHHVKRSWASLFDAQAIFYWHENQYDHFKVGIAVPVERMIESEASGVLFTVDPVTNDPSKITRDRSCPLVGRRGATAVPARHATLDSGGCRRQ